METKDTHTNANLAYAVRLVHATCCLAGSASYLDDIRADLRRHGITRAIRGHDTPALFDWLIETLSFQGISDAIAVDQHQTACARDARDRRDVTDEIEIKSVVERRVDCIRRID
jgi:hypothetical protein